MELINSFKKYLIATVPKIVFKSVTEAEKNETMASRLAGDQYIDARLETDTFMSYLPGSFSESILNQVGIHDKKQIESIQSDKFLIPDALRDKVVELKRKEIIANYEEKNNYYRALLGLPDIDDNFIYLDPDVLVSYGYYDDSKEDYENENYDKLTPLHLLPRNVLETMDNTGYLSELYDEYNDDTYHAEYIRHLGNRKVDILQARTATQYELLYVPRVENASRFSKDFATYYEEARQYFLNQIYNNHYNAEYDFYEAYIGFFILVMAIQRTINSMFEVMVERDFYDVETCRMFLEAYGVPFIESFTFNQQLTLVKNLNILLMEKCTTRVLYDILSLLEYDKYDLTKYLLVKQHKMVQETETSEPKPVFIYRTILSEDGEPIYELDKSAIYDYYFVGVDMNDTDVTLSELSEANSQSYQSLTEDDVYWIEDDELIEKLQNDEINYVETKYTNVTITIRMYQMMFEHIYLQKMICDKGSETSKINVELSLISESPISILEVEVLLICLLCKHNGLSPDLLISPSKQLAVLGFNFEADFEAIRQEVLSHPKIYSEKLADYIKNINFTSVADINEMYGNVKALYELLVEGMETTQSEQVYHAYRKLYQTLMITDVHNEVFALPDGSIPETYMDWLNIYNHSLYNYMNSVTKDESIDKINYITTKMIAWFTNTKYLNYLNPIDLTVIKNLIKMLRWFKSYTMDIKQLDVIYLFDSKYHNLMKMLGRLWFHASATIHETDIGYHEWVLSLKEWVRIKENRDKLMEAVRMSASIDIKELDKLMHDTMLKISSSFTVKDFTVSDYMDTFVMSVHHAILKDNTRPMYDRIRIIQTE